MQATYITVTTKLGRTKTSDCAAGWTSLV